MRVPARRECATADRRRKKSVNCFLDSGRSGARGIDRSDRHAASDGAHLCGNSRRWFRHCSGCRQRAVMRRRKAIMTTDTHEKEIAVEVDAWRRYLLRSAACARAPGMIHPNMCTMLSFVTTDAAISTAPASRSAAGRCHSDTYNMISVDGDTSTNDTVSAFGERAWRRIRSFQRRNEDYDRFCEALRYGQ